MSHFAVWRIEMNGRERFRATIERRTVDRPAWWPGDPLLLSRLDQSPMRTEDEIGEICVICG